MKYRYIYLFVAVLSIVLATMFSPWHPERSRVIVQAASQQLVAKKPVRPRSEAEEPVRPKSEAEEPVRPEHGVEEQFSIEELPEEPASPQFVQVDRSYFDDALFIGDSRTVGLDLYGDLGEADVFADEGMTAFRIWKVQIPFGEQEEYTLQEVLEAQKYGKIYIMLGINELGYHFDKVIEKYRETLEMVRQLQPESIIYLQANLHVTEKYAAYEPTFSNENINRINENIAGLADGQGIFYLDPNELFDDEKGNLDKNYTTDEIHLQGQYYDDWIEWMCQKAIMQETAEEDIIEVSQEQM